ncbi:MAG: class I SAM-dependent rRNA methyltransferase [Chitinispirillaceae bacterium]|nr:class I SAM-dependent rRNA methyltransferase [Chitinispirillaceae bacterium]
MMKVFLKKGREKPVLNGHPWIFSGAIRRIEGSGGPGGFCEVIGEGGDVLGHGYYNAASSITVRMLTAGAEPFTLKTLLERIERAVVARECIVREGRTDSCRIVNAEGDFLPGLIIDRYAAGIVIQINTAGMDRMRTGIIEAIASRCSPAFVLERSDADAREREGMRNEDGLKSGVITDPLVIKENGLCFAVDPVGGQKTGFYFDQRENRALARTYASGRRCLDCCSYSGAFGLNLLAGNAASVTTVDISKNAPSWCRRNLSLNGFDASRMESVCADAFDYLRSADRRFDLVVLDPPKFARRHSEASKAARGYKDLNLAAIKITESGGLLFTFSCSNAVDSRLFRQVVFAAAADAGRKVHFLHVLSAGPDHPVSLAHPEGEYLKGMVLRVY